MEFEQGFPLNKHFQPERILLPRFDTLGDLVLLEGLVGMLQQRFPRARITLLIRRPYADLSALFPLGLDWLVTEVDPHREPPDLSSCRNLLSDLHGTDWDLLLVTAYNRTWADDFVAASLPQTERIAFGHWADMPETLQKVFAGLGIRTECPYEHFVSVREDSLETAKYQAMWQALGEESMLPEPELFISEYQKAAVEHILRMAGMEPKHFCLCFPAGTQKVGIKVWPPDRFADVIAWLEKERGIRALIAGHRSEMACIEEVLRLAGDRGAKPGKWVGRDGELPILAALAESAGFYLGNDTGPMHIAAAVRTPVIGIFGGGTWPRFIPRRDKSIAIAGEMPCFGCGWNCVFGDAPCMSLVTTKDLKQAVGDLLGEAGISGFRILKGSNRLSVETERFIEKASETFRAANDDRLARLEANLRLEKLLAESEADRAARLAEIERLEKLLEECEADHTARLAEMERLGKQLAESEADRANRLVEMESLGKQLAESEADRANRLVEMERLGKQLAESEADRAARLAEMERLGRQIAESESGRTALLAKTERLERIRNSNWVKIFLKLGLIREEGSSN
jgi:ADP-heptose:LPS heptosyltransferase